MQVGPDLVIVFLLTLFLIIWLTFALKIAAESERFAVYLLGRFHSYKGPGLVLVVPFTQRVHRLRVGDVGVMSGSGFATFDGVDIPVLNTGALEQGQVVSIDAFDGVEPRLVASSERPGQQCPKCGHRF